ncbi:MAG: sulfurtransferase [Proteobacteria bacterium]|nr:sulfurtransferase [Pseudomonadota bacterium]MBU1709307.1 sulfurtransferase [Pseudomonadota bacterium]
MKKFITLQIILLLMTGIASTAIAESVFMYKKPKVQHPGKEAMPLEAYELIKKNPVEMIIVDVRTQGEYQFVGHPEGAYLVPFQILGTVFNGKEYEMIENKNFTRDLMTKFKPNQHTLFFLCRSGSRAAEALNAAVAAGWPADRAYVILGGFEGDKLKDNNSAYNGLRIGGGWRNEGLPWTYSMDSKLVY